MPSDGICHSNRSYSSIHPSCPAKRFSCRKQSLSFLIPPVRAGFPALRSSDADGFSWKFPFFLLLRMFPRHFSVQLFSSPAGLLALPPPHSLLFPPPAALILDHIHLSDRPDPFPHLPYTRQVHGYSQCKSIQKIPLPPLSPPADTFQIAANLPFLIFKQLSALRH